LLLNSFISCSLIPAAFITDEGVCVLVGVLEINKSLQKL